MPGESPPAQRQQNQGVVDFSRKQQRDFEALLLVPLRWKEWILSEPWERPSHGKRHIEQHGDKDDSRDLKLCGKQHEAVSYSP